MQLRGYQIGAIEALRARVLAGIVRILLCAPTGAGKTVMASEIIRGAVQRGKRVLFVAHRKELVDQCFDKLCRFGVSAGVIMGTDKRRDDYWPVQIGSIQTLARRMDRLPPADVVIIDEAHHAVSNTYRFLVERYPGAVVLGLTATPWRLGKLSLADMFQELVLAATPAELMAMGALVGYEAFAYDAPDLHDVSTVAGDWNSRELALACNTTVLVGSVVREYLEHAAGRRGILFPVDVAHSNQLVAEFQRAGVRAAHLDCHTPKAERERILAGLSSGAVTIVSSVGVLTEGFDCLDDRTEILTASGWRGVGQVSVGDLVYSLNRETGVGELVRADRVVERFVRPGERMVTLRSQHVNVRTTEGHEFHVKYRDPGRGGQLSSSFITRTGAQLVGRRSAYALPISLQADFPGVPLSYDELRLIAWFMTDGGFEKHNFCISQSKDYRDEIRSLLTRLGLDFSERIRRSRHGCFPNAKPLHVFRIPKGNQTGKQARRGWFAYASYLDEDVSPLLQQMTRDQFHVFWTELLKGDGAKQGNKAGWLWCDRKAQADAYTALAVVRGFAASFSVQKTKAGRDMFVVSVRDAQWITSDPGDKRAAKIAFDEPNSGEHVWCVTNRNSTLITRREGKIAIVGNCPAAEVCILARPTQSLSLHLQMIGRVLRPADDKTCALIHDHAGNLMRHGFPDDERDYSLTATPTRDRALHTCPFCKFLFGSIRSDGTCPKCGEVIAEALKKRGDGDAPEPRAAKVVVDGKRLSAAQIRAARAERERNNLRADLTDVQLVRVAHATPEEKAAEYLRLMEVVRRKGFKPGFAARAYRDCFGVWPRFSDELLERVQPAVSPFLPLPPKPRAEEAA